MASAEITECLAVVVEGEAPLIGDWACCWGGAGAEFEMGAE